MAHDAVASSVVLLLLLACASSDTAAPDQQPLLVAQTCNGAATLHGGTIVREHWEASDNPHAIVDTLTVTGTLSIEPGVEVCIEPDVPILLGETAAISARGTPADSIVLTAGDPARPWGGVRPRGECFFPSLSGRSCTAPFSIFEYVRLEHATEGISLGTSVRIAHSHFRQIRCGAVAASHLAFSRVDSAGRDGCASVVMGYGSDHFEENVIVGSGGGGLSFGGVGTSSSSVVTGSVAILGGRIEGSRDVGLSFSSWWSSATVSAPVPLRITGGSTMPVHAPMDVVFKLWPTAAAQDSIRGNASDTLRVWGAAQRVEVAPGLVLVVERRANPAAAPWSEIGAGGLVLHPGAGLVLEHMLRVHGPLHAEGSPAAPIRISGDDVLELRCTVGMSPPCDYESRIEHVELHRVSLYSEQTVTLANVVARETGGLGVSASSRVLDTLIEDARSDGLSLGAGASASNCVVRRSAGSGIVVSSPSTNVSIHQCQLEENAGPGVQNFGSDVVDARFNWWGDPAGPLGPAGDGAEGNVDYSSHLASRP